MNLMSTTTLSTLQNRHAYRYLLYYYYLLFIYLRKSLSLLESHHSHK